MTSASDRATVAILYPGEMGATVGRLLAGAGCAVVTSLAGRSARTAEGARRAGLEVLPSLEAVAERADVVLSLVSPAAALGLAREYRTARDAGTKSPAQPRRTIFVDLNSIAPETAAQIADVFRGTAIDFVDGAIHGLASGLPERGTFYLSGPAALDVARQFDGVFRVKTLGDEPGRASAFKMLIAGLNKGLSALFLEVALAARQGGLLDQLMVCFEDVYAGVMQVIHRTVPTYPQHARRRGEEMHELEQMMRGLGLEPCLVSAARALIENMGKFDLGPAPGGKTWSVNEVVEALHARGLLRKEEFLTPGGHP